MDVQAPTHRQCSRCRKLVEFTYLKTKGKLSRRRVYVDSTGAQWRGATCPPCCKPIRKSSNARRPKRPIDLCETRYVQTGRRSEYRVKEYLESCGYSVRITSGKGPDLTLSNPTSEDTTVEVKTVSRAKDSGSLYVSEVSLNRGDDDYIAYVFPDSRIHIQPMPEHLDQCGPSGKRVVTKLFWEMVENGLEIRFIR